MCDSQNTSDREQYDISEHISLLNSFHTTDNGMESQYESVDHASTSRFNCKSKCNKLINPNSRGSFECVDPKITKPKKRSHNEDKEPTKPTIYITRKPNVEKDIWKKYDNEFKEINQQSWTSLKNDELTPEQYVTDLNGMLASFLVSKPEFQKESKMYFNHNKPNENNVEEMRKLKIELNKKAKEKNATKEVKAQARQANRAFSHIKKVNKEKQEVIEKKKQEKSYRENFYKTARDVTNGVFGATESKPTFTKHTADEFYKK